MMCGGASETKPASEEIQAVMNEVRAAVEEKVGFTLSKYELISYKTQVVAGTNFFAKIDLGDTHVHARVYRNLQGEISLHSVQHPKVLEDDIEYF
ncbi:cystatin-B-like [Macrobrachium rosenbergii]|uniref:cystatin-B-like n=1 Tax=Macrobrachium rosenbergii TaxID=79674 RepID=UPI0034D56594